MLSIHLQDPTSFLQRNYIIFKYRNQQYTVILMPSQTAYFSSESTFLIPSVHTLNVFCLLNFHINKMSLY